MQGAVDAFDERELTLPDPAFSRRELVDLFNTAIVPVLGLGDVEASAVETMTYSPGRECVVLLELRRGGSAVATFGRRDVLARAFSGHYASRPPGARRAAFAAEQGCLVELFPADWRLPALEVILALEPPARRDARLPVDADVEVLRYRPHVSCVLRFTEGRPAGGSAKVVGKLYAREGGAARAFATLETLQAQARRGLVPAPVALVDDLDLVLMEHVPGTSSKRLLKRARTADEAWPAVALAAEALAALHACRLELESPGRPEHTVEQLRAGVDRLAGLAPALASRMEELLERSGAVLRSRPVTKLCCIHGDFKPSQLLLDKERVGIVDLDRAINGDPALDVGLFMAQLHKEALHRDQADLRPLAPRFLERYEACSGVEGVGDRAHACQALGLVRMALRRIRRDPSAVSRRGKSAGAAALLDEANEWLASV